MRTQYTLTGLKDYLQEKYGGKGTGGNVGFTDQDIQGYIRRGKLPDHFGGDKIKQGKQLVKGGRPVYYLTPIKT